MADFPLLKPMHEMKKPSKDVEELSRSFKTKTRLVTLARKNPKPSGKLELGPEALKTKQRLKEEGVELGSRSGIVSSNPKMNKASKDIMRRKFGPVSSTE